MSTLYLKYVKNRENAATFSHFNIPVTGMVISNL
jgi:hypothetical protein